MHLINLISMVLFWFLIIASARKKKSLELTWQTFFEVAIGTNILKFYIHLHALPDNNIARQCLQLSMGMAEKTQSGMRMTNRF